MSTSSWSLAGRLTGLFFASTTLFVLAISITSAVFLHQAVERELESLVGEELEEFEVRFEGSPHTRSDFQAIGRDLAAQHRKNPLAWRIYDPDGSVWAELGDTRLLSAPEGGLAAQNVPDLEHSLHAGRRHLASGFTVDLVLDGSHQRRQFERYMVVAGLVIIASIALTAIVSRVFFGRVSGLLRTVAERVRAVREPGAPVEFGVASVPREIEDVQNALREMLDNIRRETEQARIFAAGLAHELRSPVQNLVGETEVALITERDATTYRAVLMSNLEELRHLGDAIDNLVTICSANETRRSRARETFDLAQEANLRLKREQASAERSGERVHISVHGDTRVSGDREALLRALRNLTANAVQWTAPGSTVHVDVSGESDEVVITVDDTGPGVAEELREKIFEPFFRGPSARGRRIGYGLGLALARSAVDEQGGRIEISTSPTGGARFRVFLPRHGRTEHEHVA